jgi:iron complex outermembrane recepter protein
MNKMLLAATLTAAVTISHTALAADTAADASEFKLEEITITAQRRSENLQKSNLSIQVLGASELQRAGANSVNDLNALVPGIQISQVGAVAQISVRGISDNSTNALGNPSVSFNVDGVYVGRASSITNNFYDIDRIEVLKGPQGTLYGRNASGGAINLITKSPSIGDDSGFFELEGGNYRNIRASGAFTKSLGGQFAIRAAFQTVDRNGYLSDGSSDLKQQAGRIRALWKPSDDVSLMLNFDLAHQGGVGAGQVLRGSGFDGVTFAPFLVTNADPWQGLNDPASAALLFKGSPAAFRPGLQYTGQRRQDNSYYDISAQLDWNFGPVTLTVIPAYRNAKEDYQVWNGFSFAQQNKSDQTSLEARLGHNTESLKWVFGGYYYDENNDVTAPFNANDFVFNSLSLYKPTTKSYAAFGEASVSILPSLRIIGGIRYTDDKKNITGGTYNQSVFGPPGTLSEPITGAAEFKKTTWKAGVEYDVASQSMLYATASTGFKSGGFNTEVDLPAQGLRNRYEPEELTSYVVGLRNRFLDNKLQVNLEAFYYDYKNKQESAISFTNGANVGFISTNAGKARIQGASVDAIFKPTGVDTIHISTEYNDNKYNKFVYYVPVAFFNPFATGCQTPASDKPGFAKVDCSGKPLVKAPEWVGSYGYEHQFDLSNGASLRAAIDGQYSSRSWVGTDYILGEEAPGYALFNASLGYAPASTVWSLTAYVKNIGDVATYKNSNVEIVQGPLVTTAIGDPRTYGARLRFNF